MMIIHFLHEHAGRAFFGSSLSTPLSEVHFRRQSQSDAGHRNSSHPKPTVAISLKGLNDDHGRGSKDGGSPIARLQAGTEAGFLVCSLLTLPVAASPLTF